MRCARRASASTAPASTPPWPSRRPPRAPRGRARAKATDEVWFDIAETHGGTEFTGYDRNRTARASVVALVKDGQPSDGGARRATRSPSSSPTRRRSTAKAAARWAMRARSAATTAAAAVSTTRQKPLGAARASGADRGGRAEGRRYGEAVGRCRSPRPHPRQPFGDAPAARGAAQAAGRARHAEGLAGRADRCVSTSHTQGADAAGDRRRRGRGEPPDPRE
jgi:hypothetical protein